MTDFQTEISRSFEAAWHSGPSLRAMALVHNSTEVEQIKNLCRETFVEGALAGLRMVEKKDANKP